jgi:hypothetical protein
MRRCGRGRGHRRRVRRRDASPATGGLPAVMDERYVLLYGSCAAVVSTARISDRVEDAGQVGVRLPGSDRCFGWESRANGRTTAATVPAATRRATAKIAPVRASALSGYRDRTATALTVPGSGVTIRVRHRPRARNQGQRIADSHATSVILAGRCPPAPERRPTDQGRARWFRLACIRVRTCV